MTRTNLDVLFRAIADRDRDTVLRMLDRSPHLATDAASIGATRLDSAAHFLEPIAHYVYTGDTAMHIAAAAHDAELVDRLLSLGADAGARNRLGATPLHLASDGQPGSSTWRPAAQVATIARLIAAGVDPNVADKRGVTPLHRAIRTRSSAAARLLVELGADRTNRAGSTPSRLATSTTGRGGSGSPAAKAEQSEILRLLRERQPPDAL